MSTVNDTVNDTQLLTTAQAAAFLGVAPGTLVKWRSRGQQGPPYVRVVGRIRYWPRDLKLWLDKNTIIAREDLGDETFD
jgi:hypothetical protein